MQLWRLHIDSIGRALNKNKSIKSDFPIKITELVLKRSSTIFDWLIVLVLRCIGNIPAKNISDKELFSRIPGVKRNLNCYVFYPLSLTHVDLLFTALVFHWSKIMRSASLNLLNSFYIIRGYKVLQGLIIMK